MAGFNLYNATSVAIAARFDGGNYIFKPKEEKNIFHSSAARHILNRWGKYGLVDTTYTERVAKEFLSPDIYKHHQTILGLETLLETKKSESQRYAIYDEQFGNIHTPERSEFAKKHKKVLEYIKQIEDEIRTVKKIDMKKLIEDSAGALRARANELLEQAKALSNGKKSNNTQGAGAVGSS